MSRVRCIVACMLFCIMRIITCANYSTPAGLERSDGCNVSQRQVTIVGGLPLALDDDDDGSNPADVAKLLNAAKNLRKRQRRPVRKTLRFNMDY